jgi:pimeloyl-ACP methyl ester carboxylesterase
MHEPQVEIVPTERGPVEVARVGGTDTAKPVVLLIHGMPGSWRQAVTLATDLVPESRVVLPSRPGYGLTPLASGGSPDEQAELYAALLDALGVASASIVGISGGGPSALAFAQNHPERVESLTLLCALAPHLIDVPAAMRLGLALPPLARAVSVIQRRKQRRVLGDPALTDARIRSELTTDEMARLDADPRIRTDLVAFLHSHADAPAGLAGLANDARHVHAARRARRPQPTDRIRARTLVLHGETDPVVRIDHAHHHVAAIPGAQLETYPDAGHVFLITRRSETVAALKAHLFRQEATSP